MNMNKKGSHVGIIASFGIFVMFLIAIYVVVDPMLRVEKDKQLALNYLETEILNAFSDNLTIAIINVTSSVDNMRVDHSITEVDSGWHAIVKDENGNVRQSDFNADHVLIELDSEGTILWVYYSPIEFSANLLGGGVGSPAEIKSVRTNKEMFELKIISGINDFENFKSNVSLSNNEFSFSFEMANGTILSAGEKQVSEDVYAMEIPIQYIDYYADNQAGKLTIRVW